MAFDWYAEVSGPDLAQGDILFDIPVPVPALPDKFDPQTPVPIDVQTLTAIIMTQSCDLVDNKLDYITVCPVVQLGKLAAIDPQFASDGGKDTLRQGRHIWYHLLNRCEMPAFQKDYLVVTFERIIELKRSYVQTFASQQEKRLRLLPPYREHLSQSFARLFMRVGLPIDIPPFKKKAGPTVQGLTPPTY